MNCPSSPTTDLSLPKFGIDTRAEPLPILQAMGMRDATNAEVADFSGITGGAGHVHREGHPPGEHRRRRDGHRGRGRDGRESATRPAAAARQFRSSTRSCASISRSCTSSATPDRGDPVHGPRPRSRQALTPRARARAVIARVRASHAFHVLVGLASRHVVAVADEREPEEARRRPAAGG